MVIQNIAERIHDYASRAYDELHSLFYPGCDKKHDFNTTIPPIFYWDGRSVERVKPQRRYDYVKERLDYAPRKPTPNEIRSVTCCLVNDEDQSVCSHTPPYILITPKFFKYDIVHELTHALVNIQKSEVMVPTRILPEFKGQSPRFGKVAYNAAQVISAHSINMDMDEFYPPLGVARVLGGRYARRDSSWESVLETQTLANKKGRVKSRRDIKDTLTHLPTIAGELMVDQYKGDTRAILREHPRILRLDGEHIWDKYVRPLLEGKKLN
jgi:hypothetical protein